MEKSYGDQVEEDKKRDGDGIKLHVGEADAALKDECVSEPTFYPTAPLSITLSASGFRDRLKLDVCKSDL